MTLTAVTFTVYGQLPRMNELIDLRARSVHAYNRRKKEAHEMVGAAARGIEQVFNSADFEFIFLELHRHFDPDNVALGGIKCILDGLQLAGVLKNDGWSDISSIKFSWVQSSEGPATRVIISGETDDRTTARKRRSELLQRKFRNEVERAKKATKRPQHHGLDGKTLRAPAKPRGKTSRAGVPGRRRE